MTKPTLTATMIEQALDVGMSARWMVSDEVYGGDPRLAAAMEGRGRGYVLAIASTTRVQVGVIHRFNAASVAAAPPNSAFEERSAGAGAHGQRCHQWAWVALEPRQDTVGGCWG